MEIKIPTKISQLKVNHVKAFNYIQEDIPTIKDKVNIVSIITGIPYNDLIKYDANGIRTAYEQVIKCFNTYKEKPLPLTITLEGTKYNLIDRFDKHPVGAYIDMSVLDFEKKPSLLCAFTYIEDGLEYAQKDKHKNIMNPIKERAEVFERNISLDTFLDMSAFFLIKHEQYKSSYTLIQIARERLNKKKESRLNGKK